jgi:hypothetical protein
MEEVFKTNVILIALPSIFRSPQVICLLPSSLTTMLYVCLALSDLPVVYALGLFVHGLFRPQLSKWPAHPVDSVCLHSFVQAPLLFSSPSPVGSVLYTLRLLSLPLMELRFRLISKETMQRQTYKYCLLRLNTGSVSILCLYKTKQSPWSEFASELHRPSDHHLSAKWLPIFADRGFHVVSVTDPYGRILDFLDRNRYFYIK